MGCGSSDAPSEKGNPKRNDGAHTEQAPVQEPAPSSSRPSRVPRDRESDKDKAAVSASSTTSASASVAKAGAKISDVKKGLNTESAAAIVSPSSIVVKERKKKISSPSEEDADEKDGEKKSRRKTRGDGTAPSDSSSSTARAPVTAVPPVAPVGTAAEVAPAVMVSPIVVISVEPVIAAKAVTPPSVAPPASVPPPSSTTPSSVVSPLSKLEIAEKEKGGQAVEESKRRSAMKGSRRASDPESIPSVSGTVTDDSKAARRVVIDSPLPSASPKPTDSSGPKVSFVSPPLLRSGSKDSDMSTEQKGDKSVPADDNARPLLRGPSAWGGSSWNLNARTSTWNVFGEKDPSKRGHDIEIESPAAVKAAYTNFKDKRDVNKQKQWRVWNELELKEERDLQRLQGFFSALRKHLPVSVPLMKGGQEVGFPPPGDMYSGLTLHTPMSSDDVLRLAEYFRQGKLLHAHYVYGICREAEDLFKEGPSLERIRVKHRPNALDEVNNPPDGSKITVVGDLHGQLNDLLHILSFNGLPSETNKYLFNGDFVDRGPCGVEVVLLLLSCKLVWPYSVYLNRGNHEDRYVSIRYGFKDEMRFKYGVEAGEALYAVVNDTFSWLPLASAVENKVIVIHGGIPTAEGENVTIRRIEQVQRGCHPQEAMMDNTRAPTPDESFMMELLWNDPQDDNGVKVSDRGSSCRFFGPDITTAFIKRNRLQLVVRSHECIPEGFEWSHSGQILTVFSASDYYEEGSNDGSVVTFDSRGNLKINVFTAPLLHDLEPLPGTPPLDAKAAAADALRAQHSDEDGDEKSGEPKEKRTMGSFLRLQGGRRRSLKQVATSIKLVNMFNRSVMHDVQLRKVAQLIVENKSAMMDLFIKKARTNPILSADAGGLSGGGEGWVTKEHWKEVMTAAIGLDVDWLSLLDELAPANALDVRGPPSRFVHFSNFLDRYSLDIEDTESHAFYALYKFRVEVEAMFAFFDSDCSGTIDDREFREGMAVLNQALGENALTDKQIDEILKTLDVDNNGSIDINEFLECFRLSDNLRKATSGADKKPGGPLSIPMI